MKTVSLSLAKQLKEAGYPQEASFIWSKPVDDFGKSNGDYFVEISDRVCWDESHQHKPIAAPTADEILERLPRKIKKGTYWLQVETMDDEKGWACQYKNVQETYHFVEGNNMIDVIASMWIYLKEHNLLKPSVAR